MRRSAGILLPLSALPNTFPIGDVGPGARLFIDWLARAGQTWWQVLPLLPPDTFGSPYASRSSMAMSPTYVSPEDLAADGFIEQSDVPRPIPSTQHQTDYAAATALKRQLLDLAFVRFTRSPDPALVREFHGFQSFNAHWLDAFTTFTVLRESYGEQPWWQWPAALRARDVEVIAQVREERRGLIQRVAFGQWIAFRQWHALRSYAHDHGVRFIGDVPFFVTRNSADVWWRQDQFLLDAEGNPTIVAGVPPDAFSEIGQLWGNPHYDWDAQRRDTFTWWRRRFHHAASVYDALRLDHFRGYESLWAIPAAEHDARRGQWVATPGDELLSVIVDAAGSTGLIAEDLGVITDAVLALRDRFKLPGSRVIQFGFGDDLRNPSLPHNAPERSVVYTSTHDTPTLRSWIEEADAASRDRALAYGRCTAESFAWRMVEQGMRSPAATCIATVQDLLNLGGTSRFNTPNTHDGNWIWRMDAHPLTPALAERLRTLTKITHRTSA